MITRTFPTLANRKHPAYSSPVATLLATNGSASPRIKRSTSSHLQARSFFSPAFNGGAVREAFAPFGFLLPELAGPHSATAHHLQVMPVVPKQKELRPMNHLHTALKNRAAAHKAMAFAALRADSSASVRLGRYRKHIDRSRTLLALADVIGGAL